ncbi:hypothetical protein HYW18_02260 [Candidatus Uhrbacteria bacterium]|nr:hypothetical protein [Candidatus Uhrbacteria bacterium]
MNRTSGSRWWWLVFGASIFVMLAWFAFALPLVDLFTGSHIGIGQFGHDSYYGTTAIFYGVELTDEPFTYYWATVFFSSALFKYAHLWMMRAHAYVKGYQYLRTGIWVPPT